MRLIFTSIFLLSCNNQQYARPAIIGGTTEIPENHPGHYATVGLALNSSLPICSGVIVDERLIMTAAHCMPETARASGVPYHLEVLFGNPEAQIRKAVARWQVYRSQLHEQTMPSYDVAWVMLDEPLPDNYHPVNILTNPNKLPPGTNLELVGYGVTSDKQSIPDGYKRLVQTTLTEFYATAHADGVFKYSGVANKGACRGDSGGPAFVNIGGEYQLAGITQGVNGYLLSSTACEAGEGLYTFAGNYKPWLDLVATGEFDSAARLSDWPKSLPELTTFRDYCNSHLLPHDAWSTIKQILDKRKTRDCNVVSGVIDNDHVLDFVGDNATAFSLDLVGHLTFLKTLAISRNNPKVDNLQPLSNLKHLKSLTLSWQNIKDVAPLADLKELEYLDLDKNSIEDISILAKLPKLKWLSVRGNPIKNKVCPLASGGVCQFDYL